LPDELERVLAEAEAQTTRVPCSRLLIDELRVNGRAEIRYRIVAPVDCATSEKVGRTEHCANQVAFDARPLRVA
jgi:hypothetical protein